MSCQKAVPGQGQSDPSRPGDNQCEHVHEDLVKTVENCLDFRCPKKVFHLSEHDRLEILYCRIIRRIIGSVA